MFFGLCSALSTENQIIPSSRSKVFYADHTIYDKDNGGGDGTFDDDEQNLLDRRTHLDDKNSTRKKPILGRRQQEQQAKQRGLPARSVSGISTGSGNSYRISARAKTLRVVEDEIFLLTLDLKWTNSSYAQYEEQVLVNSRFNQSSGNGKDSTDGVFLCYDCAQTIPSYPHNLTAFKSALVLVLRSTLAGVSFGANTMQTLQQLLTAMASLQYLVENYQELPAGFDPNSPYNHNCLTSIEYAFMFSHILMAANVKYLIQVYDFHDKNLNCLYGDGNGNSNQLMPPPNSVKNSLFGKVVNKNEILANESTGPPASKDEVGNINNKNIKNRMAPNSVPDSPIQNPNNSRGTSSFIRQIQDLINALNNVLHYSTEKSQTSSLIAYSHMLVKVCKTIHYLVMIFEQRHQEMILDFRNYYDSFQELVTLLGSLVPAFQVVKMFLNNESLYYYIFSMRFWQVSEQLLWLIYYFLNKFPVSNPPSPYRAMFMLWKQKVFACIYTILPMPSEFFFELHRMESRRQNVIGLSDDFLFDNFIEELLNAPENRPIDQSNRLIRSTKRSTQELLMLPPKPGTNSQDDPSPRPPIGGNTGRRVASQRVDVMSFHARFILMGMMRFMQLHPPYNLRGASTVIGQNYSNAVSRPLREKYFIVLHEILFHLLDATVEKKGLFKPHLLTIIAHLLMKLSLSMDRSPATDWAFWRMAKEMAKFNDYLRRRQLHHQAWQQQQNQHLLQGHSTSRSQELNGALASRTSSSALNTHRSMSNNNNNNNMSNHSISLDTGMDTPLFKDLRSYSPSPLPALKQWNSAQLSNKSMSPVPMASENNHATQQFEIDEPVDALFLLPNGTERWYPGKVTAFDRSRGTYSILFNDGDRADAKSPSEIRKSKTKRSRPVSSSGSESKKVVVSAVPSYAVDDQLDGLCRLSNGSERWFPCRVTAVHASAVSTVTYDVLFTDGEVRNNVPEADLRATKQRRVRSANQSSMTRSNDMDGNNHDDSALTDSDVMKPLRSLPSLDIHSRQPMTKHPLATVFSVGEISISSLHTSDDETDIALPRLESKVDVNDDDDDDDEEDDLIFDIPSVFDTNRDASMLAQHSDFIPKVQINGLPRNTTGNQMLLGGSLSAGIIFDEVPSNVSTPLAMSMTKSVPNLKGALSLRQPNVALYGHMSDGDMFSPGMSVSASVPLLSDLSNKSTPHPLNLGPRFHEIASQNTPIDTDLGTASTYQLSWRNGNGTANGNVSFQGGVMGMDSTRTTGNNNNNTNTNGAIHTNRSFKSRNPNHNNSGHQLLSSARSDTGRGQNGHGVMPPFPTSSLPARSNTGPVLHFHDEYDRFLAEEREEMFSEETNLIVQYLLDTYNILTIVLLKHCLLQSTELDYACCKMNDDEIDHNTQTAFQTNMHTARSGIANNNSIITSRNQMPRVNSIANPNNNANANGNNGTTKNANTNVKMISDSTNVLFILRDYLELTSTNAFSKHYIASVAMYLRPGVYRLCKLLSPVFFNTCLQEHICQEELATKMGEGGFGSVYRVCCPSSCNKFHAYSHCFACYQRDNYYHYLSTGKSASRCRCWRTTRRLRRDVKPKGVKGKGEEQPARVNGKPEYPESTAGDNPTHNVNSSAIVDRNFAVKRLTRERSEHDQSITFSLFQEISSLEKLHDCIGVCGLEDYGISGSEYWLVLEAGKCNISDWRENFRLAKENTRLQEREKERNHDRDVRDRRSVKQKALDMLNSHNSSTGGTGGTGGGGGGRSSRDIVGESGEFESEEFNIAERDRASTLITRQDLLLFLVLFLDMLLIVRDVHDRDIAHFDLKGANFILREDPVPLLSSIVLIQQQQRKASGILFLADFGEAIVNITSLQNPSAMRHRSRGTLCIQSPEMLAISEQNQSDATTMSILMNTHLYSEMMLNDFVGRSKGSFSRNSFATPSSANNALPTFPQMVPPPHGKTLKKKKFPVPDQRSDVWSMGCLFFELVCNKMLFAEKSWPELYTKFCLETPLDGSHGRDLSTDTFHAARVSKLFERFSMMQHTIDSRNGLHSSVSPERNTSSGVANTPVADTNNKMCSMLLAQIECDAMLDALSEMTLDIQRRVVSMLCQCLRPDPKQRVSIMQLIDDVDDIISALLVEISVTASNAPVQLSYPPMNRDIFHSTNSENSNSFFMPTLSSPILMPPQSHAMNNITVAPGTGMFDDLSINITVSLSGWTIDHAPMKGGGGDGMRRIEGGNGRSEVKPDGGAKGTNAQQNNSISNHNNNSSASNSVNTSKHISESRGGISKQGSNSTRSSTAKASSLGLLAALSPLASPQSLLEDSKITIFASQQVVVGLPYSLTIKLSDSVYVASKPIFLAILRQFLHRKVPNVNESLDREDDCDANLRHMSHYLGEFIHPLDSNYKLFRSCYDIQDSIYTQHYASYAASYSNQQQLLMSGASHSVSAFSSKSNVPIDGQHSHRMPPSHIASITSIKVENSIENITATELFSDLIMFLLHSNSASSMISSASRSSGSGNNNSNGHGGSSVAVSTSAAAAMPTTSTIFSKGPTMKKSGGKTSLQFTKSKQAAEAMRALKAPIVWVRLYYTTAEKDAKVNDKELADDEALAAKCGIIVIPVHVEATALTAATSTTQKILRNWSSENIESNGDLESELLQSMRRLQEKLEEEANDIIRLDFKAMWSAVSQASSAIQVTTAARGASPIVVITIDDHSSSVAELAHAGSLDFNANLQSARQSGRGAMGTSGGGGGALRTESNELPIHGSSKSHINGVISNIPTTSGSANALVNGLSGNSCKIRPVVPKLATPSTPFSAMGDMSAAAAGGGGVADVGSGNRDNELDSEEKDILPLSLLRRSAQPYGEHLHRVEASFSLAIAGFLSHATTKSEMDPMSMDSAVQHLARVLRFMPWVEELIDSQVLFSFLMYCYRQELKIE